VLQSVPILGYRRLRRLLRFPVPASVRAGDAAIFAISPARLEHGVSFYQSLKPFRMI